MKKVKKSALLAKIEAMPARSAWSKGVKAEAYSLVEREIEADEIAVEDFAGLREILLNGASDWKQYAFGGCGLIYNGDIAKAFCAPSELRKTKNGANDPNNNETWMDVYARALFQACEMIRTAFYSL